MAQSFRSFVLIVIALTAFALSGAAWQRGGGRSTVTPPPTLPTSDTSSQLTFLSGKVMFEGGGAPTEPMVIERVCSGSARREGYTDSNGQFQFQLGQIGGFQDASETNVSLAGGDRQSSARQTPESRYMQLMNCELRAVLPGFQSTLA